MAADTVTITAPVTIDDVTITVNALTDDVTVSVTSVVDDVTVEVSSDTGPQGPAGVDYDPKTSWFGLAVGAVPTGPTAITGGRVYTYNYGTTTRYRFISTDNATDAFYSGFNGTNLTGLVATKALTF
jgi:hypothetical protein